jgi:methionyl-tRNA formyltransferase
MRIVFFGTPAFAEASLRALLAAGHDVAGVVTQPDRPQRRSRSTLVPPPVKLLAESAGLPVLQPERPAGDLFLAALRRFGADLGVVVAYGHILRQPVLDAPRLGMVNVHASLLPRLRGAAPVQWAIANGDRETGVSIMQMDAGMDTGPVLARSATPIGPDETGGELTTRLATLGAETLVGILPDIARGTVRAEPQDESLATVAGKIGHETARIDWAAPADVVARRIRAFDPVPGAWTRLDGAEVKLAGARAVAGADAAAGGTPGEVLAAGDRLLVAAGGGAVEIASAQPAGKRKLSASDWSRGRGIAVGRRFT